MIVFSEGQLEWNETTVVDEETFLILGGISIPLLVIFFSLGFTFYSVCLRSKYDMHAVYKSSSKSDEDNRESDQSTEASGKLLPSRTIQFSRV